MNEFERQRRINKTFETWQNARYLMLVDCYPEYRDRLREIGDKACSEYHRLKEGIKDDQTISRTR